tara:strand:+ start:514 stop:1119 length:606 start_codon:yes stop_codon:yes gene_type:complete
MYKTCSCCKEHKFENEYHKLNGGMYGRHSICKDCRSRNRRRMNNDVKIEHKQCKECNNIYSYNKFYKNKNSKDGLQSYCKNCHKKKISNSNSKIDRFSKIILKKFKNLNKNCTIEINYKDIIEQYKKQDSKCFITNHNMTHISDLKQRTDNIWNLSIFCDSEKLTKNNLKLVCHFIYTIKKVYNIPTNNFLRIYNQIIKNM